MSLPETFRSEYYDEAYFKTPRGKVFQRPDGSTDAWSYANPTGEFLGAKPIAEAWKTIFQPRTMLDVGAGRGTFIAYARDVGILAEGFDFSDWAVGDEGRYPRCRAEWLRQGDATDFRTWRDYQHKQFDLVIALDFLEHIYLEYLDPVIDEMLHVAGKWVFLQIAVVDGIREKGYTLRKGEPIPLEVQPYAVAGHVTVQTESWWYGMLDREGWMPRRDMVEWFCSLVPKEVIKNWLANSIIVLERVE